MAERWYLELVEVAEGDLVYSHAISDRIWLDERARVVMGRVPSADVYCLGRGQGGRRALVVEQRAGTLWLQQAGHDLPVWHRGRPVRNEVSLASGDRFGPSYGISFVVGRADPGPLPGAHRIGPAVAFAPRGSGSAPRVWSGFRADDATRGLVDVLSYPAALTRDVAPRVRAEQERAATGNVHATHAKILDSGLCEDTQGVWALRESTLGVTLPAFWDRTDDQRASLDVDSAAFLVEQLGRGLLAGALEWRGLATAGVVLRFVDGQPLLVPQPLVDAPLLPQLDEENAASVALEVAGLLARCLQPGRGHGYAWTPPTQARADVRAVIAATPELADDVRILAVAAAHDDPARRPTAPALLDALAAARAARGADDDGMRAHLRDVVAHLFPAERAAAEEMREAMGVIDVERVA
jgi:hypothetical protein